MLAGGNASQWPRCLSRLLKSISRNMGEGNKMNKVYDMELHEKLNPEIKGSYVDIIRVPGGWIYYTQFMKADGGCVVSSVFVPFNDEFKDDADDFYNTGPGRVSIAKSFPWSYCDCY